MPENARVVLKLYVAGGSAHGERAVRRLGDLLAGRDDCEVTVVDILRDPQAAEDNRIMALPALIKESPLPVRRLVGDLSDTETLLMLLDLPTVKPDQENR